MLIYTHKLRFFACLENVFPQPARLLSLAGLVETVRFQHTPSYASEDKASSALLNIASLGASAMEEDICPDPGPAYLELIDEQSWQLAGVESTDLEAAIEFAHEEAWNILGVISSAVY